jgi:hypothetical protein
VSFGVRVNGRNRRISPISSRLGQGRLTESDSGRSTWKTRTGLHAPKPTLGVRFLALKLLPPTSVRSAAHSIGNNLSLHGDARGLCASAYPRCAAKTEEPKSRAQPSRSAPPQWIKLDAFSFVLAG